MLLANIVIVTKTCPCVTEIGHWQRRKNAAGEVNELVYIDMEQLLCFRSGENTALDLLKGERTEEIQLDKTTNSIFF